MYSLGAQGNETNCNFSTFEIDTHFFGDTTKPVASQQQIYSGRKRSTADSDFQVETKNREHAYNIMRLCWEDEDKRPAKLKWNSKACWEKREKMSYISTRLLFSSERKKFEVLVNWATWLWDIRLLLGGKSAFAKYAHIYCHKDYVLKIYL